MERSLNQPYEKISPTKDEMYNLIVVSVLMHISSHVIKPNEVKKV
jgi:hypothetical protein